MEREIDFGDYVMIEQQRYGVDNEMYKYKVVGGLRSNHYRSVPFEANKSAEHCGKMTEILQVIQCGICEDEVERVRREDVMPEAVTRAIDRQIKRLKSLDMELNEISSIEF